MSVRQILSFALTMLLSSTSGGSLAQTYSDVPDDPFLAYPDYKPWVIVFEFSPTQSRHCVGVAYNKNANEEERYVVASGVEPEPMLGFYDKNGNLTRTCSQYDSSGWGMRDLAYGESNNEFYGGGWKIRQVFLENCEIRCLASPIELNLNIGTAFEDGGSSRDTL